MFKNYIYEKPNFIGKKNTDALTAAFAGGGWLHLNDYVKKDETKIRLHANDAERSH